MLRLELWPLASDFASLALRFTDESKRVTSHFLTELDVACERQEEAEASDARSRAATAKAERAVVVVCKELEDALARADDLTTRLQAVEAKCARAEEAAKASAEALAAHLGQLQKARAKRDGMHSSPSCFYCLRSFCHLAVFVVLTLASLCAVRAEFERELVAVRESSARAGRARKELGVVMSRVAQELGVTKTISCPLVQCHTA